MTEAEAGRWHHGRRTVDALKVRTWYVPIVMLVAVLLLVVLVAVMG